MWRSKSCIFFQFVAEISNELFNHYSYNIMTGSSGSHAFPSGGINLGLTIMTLR